MYSPPSFLFVTRTVQDGGGGEEGLYFPNGSEACTVPLSLSLSSPAAAKKPLILISFAVEPLRNAGVLSK